MDTGWVLASVVFLSTCLALASAIVQSPLLRSSAFISHLLTPLTWAMWVSALDQTAFSFSIWSLVSLVALVGAVLVEHGLELDFQLVSAGETALKDDLRKAATPVFCGASALETGSLQAPTL